LASFLMVGGLLLEFFPVFQCWRLEVVVEAVPLCWRGRFCFYAGSASSFEHSFSLGTITGTNKNKKISSFTGMRLAQSDAQDGTIFCVMRCNL
jgi:hypothetical protein